MKAPARAGGPKAVFRFAAKRQETQALFRAFDFRERRLAMVVAQGLQFGKLAALDLPYDRFCFACFDGNYPEPVPYDVEERKFILEKELTTKRNTAASELEIARMELEKLLGAKGGSGSEGKNSDMIKRRWARRRAPRGA